MPPFAKSREVHSKIQSFLDNLKSPKMDRYSEAAAANVTSSSANVVASSTVTGIDERTLRDVFSYLQMKREKAEEDVFTKSL